MSDAELFEADLAARLDEIERLAREGSAATAHDIAHGLKGAALTLGLDDVAVAAAALETAIDHDDARAAERALVSARGSLGRISARKLIHDLRGSLNAVMGYSHLLVDELEEGDARDHARAIVEASYALNEAIDRFDTGMRPVRRERTAPTVTASPPLPVLLVEDDDPSAGLVEAILAARTGVTLTRARSLAEAVAALEQDEIRLVLVDRWLGSEDGLELVRTVRERRGDDVTVVVTTAGGARDEAPLLAAGAQAVLPKPVVQDELLALVDRIATA